MSLVKRTRITLARSGGVAGIRPPPLTLDTADIAKDLAARIETLLVTADFFTLPAELPESSPSPDSFQYSLAVHHASGREHRVTFSEAAASEALRELKRLVRDSAKR